MGRGAGAVMTPASSSNAPMAARAWKMLHATKGHMAQPIAKPAGVLTVSVMASSAASTAITATIPT